MLAGGLTALRGLGLLLACHLRWAGLGVGTGTGASPRLSVKKRDQGTPGSLLSALPKAWRSIIERAFPLRVRGPPIMSHPLHVRMKVLGHSAESKAPDSGCRPSDQERPTLGPLTPAPASTGSGAAAALSASLPSIETRMERPCARRRSLGGQYSFQQCPRWLFLGDGARLQ